MILVENFGWYKGLLGFESSGELLSMLNIVGLQFSVDMWSCLLSFLLAALGVSSKASRNLPCYWLAMLYPAASSISWYVIYLPAAVLFCLVSFNRMYACVTISPCEAVGLKINTFGKLFQRNTLVEYFQFYFIISWSSFSLRFVIFSGSWKFSTKTYLASQFLFSLNSCWRGDILALHIWHASFCFVFVFSCSLIAWYCYCICKICNF